jgi:hypothetical protein
MYEDFFLIRLFMYFLIFLKLLMMASNFFFVKKKALLSIPVRRKVSVIQLLVITILQ